MAEHDLGRMQALDARPISLDGFGVADPELGLIALTSPHDPEPSLVVVDGRVVELDGRAETDFDIIDTFVARHGIDLAVAAEVMAMSDLALARLAVDPNCPRAEVVRLVGGTTVPLGRMSTPEEVAPHVHSC